MCRSNETPEIVVGEVREFGELAKPADVFLVLLGAGFHDRLLFPDVTLTSRSLVNGGPPQIRTGAGSR